MKEKGHKIKYKGSGAIDVTIIGNAIDHFFVNFNSGLRILVPLL